MSELFEIEGSSVFIPQAGLYLDDRRKRAFAFASHAHSDHFAKHDQILCTPQTAALLGKRLKNSRYLICPFRKPMEINGVRITLYPAGHILGSAQVLLEYEGQSLLYTGDFRTATSRTAEPFELIEADTVIMETTFGRPHYTFPSRADSEQKLLNEIHNALESGRTPVIFGYTLGKAQEALSIISGANMPVAVEYSILRFIHIYQKFGTHFGAYTKFRRSDDQKGAVLLPASHKRHKYVQNIKNVYTIYLSGWGMDSSSRFRFGVDTVIPFSDHADFEELIAFAKDTHAKTVYCTHGFDSFIHTLREHGVNAQWLIPKPQMELF